MTRDILSPRRDFLKTATAGVGGLVALPESAAAKPTPAAAKTFYEVPAFGAKGDAYTLDSWQLTKPSKQQPRPVEES